ncbi:hypothetical protein SCHPADRAFT_989625 [Schizopora paradoxa]|uniref:Uncharacterized protein n=1 Tax=Schizopora paradoxa TaxID=27342 RepID=A0A0H2RI20_9AGAM|nr:hypothetical protein SCHPADRAFT_989625 [Schizopora paradoxa]
MNLSGNGLDCVIGEAGSASPASPPPASEKFYSDIGCGDRLKITHQTTRPPPPEPARVQCWKMPKSLYFSLIATMKTGIILSWFEKFGFVFSRKLLLESEVDAACKKNANNDAAGRAVPENAGKAVLVHLTRRDAPISPRPLLHFDHHRHTLWPTRTTASTRHWHRSVRAAIPDSSQNKTAA